jgi:SAM-dependent methyltransferase
VGGVRDAVARVEEGAAGVMGTNAVRTGLKSTIGPRLTVLSRCVLRGLPIPHWGNLRRVSPLSSNFGFERGTPVDRFYLHRFLEANRAHITGRVLEIQVSSYTRTYGHDVEMSHTVDINPAFAATYTCDLANAPQIPSSYYDCFLLPNTLQHVQDPAAVLRTALRVVKPGGSILASAPVLLPLIPDGDDYWRFSPAGWRMLLAREWAGCEIAVEGHGNCLSASAAMYGIALEELRDDELTVHDPRYPVLVTIACRKTS